MKRLLLRLLLVAVALALVLAATEFGVRQFLSEGLVPELLQPEAGQLYFDARMLVPIEEDGVRYAGRPGAEVRVRDVDYRHDDEDGLRIAPPPGPKPDGTFRVVIVGDSNAYGWGVPEEATFARRVETGLTEAGLTVDVAVLAFPGYNTGDEAALLRRLGPKLAPDLVLVAWFANDLERLGFHVDHDGWFFSDPLPFQDRWKPLFWRSYLYRRFAVNEVSRMRADGEYVLGEGENLTYAEEKLLEIVAVARSLDAKCAVLDVPVLEAPVGGPGAVGSGVMAREGYRGAKASGWLKDTCQLHGLPRLDLLDAVIGESVPLLWASPEHKNHHPSAAAHARFATAIVPWLQEQGLVPTP